VSRLLALAALAWGLAAAPALAARPTPSPTPTPAGLPIKGVTVEVQPIELAPGLPAGAPAGSHVEQPPGRMRGFATPKRPKPSASPGPSRRP
jgi:hypothetical protein